jgi:tetratricopeptide (TPR) repeat protein
LEEAVELLKRAVRKSKSPEILDSLGWAYVKLGEVEKGLKLLKAAVERIPDNWEVRYHLSVAYKKIGNLAFAKVEEEKARILLDNFKKIFDLLKKKGGFLFCHCWYG